MMQSIFAVVIEVVKQHPEFCPLVANSIVIATSVSLNFDQFANSCFTFVGLMLLIGR